MQADPRRTYALIHIGLAMTAADYAPLEVARAMAQDCRGTAHALLIGTDTEAAVTRARELGLDSVWAIAPPDTSQPLQAQQITDVFAAALSSADSAGYTDDSLFLVAAGSAGEEIAGRLAARLKAVPLGKCQHFEFDSAGEMSVQRAAFGGRLNVTFECRKGPFIAAVRKPDGATETQPPNEKTMVVHHVSCAATLRPAYAMTAEVRAEQHASLEGARLVVSGGRGMGGETGFTALYELAAQLGGAVGGSLPAIDAGWAPVARQVGQSGKYVSPDIYLAIGISGTPQHMAGIDPHTKVIAVNKDPEAGIFQAAHIGVVADWQELLPALMTELNKAGH